MLCNKSSGNAALADVLKNKISHSPLGLLQNGPSVEQPFMNFPAVYRCVLFVTSQPVSDTQLSFKPVALSPIRRISGGDKTSLVDIVGSLHTPYFGFRAEPDIQPLIWKKAIANTVFNSFCPLLETGQLISTLQDIRNHRPKEIATLNLAIAGMAATCRPK